MAVMLRFVGGKWAIQVADVEVEDAFSICRTQDKVVGQLVGGVFGLLCIHTHQYNMGSHPYEVRWGRLTPP